LNSRATSIGAAKKSFEPLRLALRRSHPAQETRLRPCESPGDECSLDSGQSRKLSIDVSEILHLPRR
jgi:hypothetical protein